MQRFCTRLFVALTAVVLHASAAAADVNVLERSYAIFRDGSEIGTRELRIARNGDSLEVVNETRIAVKVLFVTVYKRHELLREVWRDGRLVRFSSQVNNDGERFEVTAERDGNGRLRVDGAAGTYHAPPGTLPATYWHESIVGTDTLIHVMRGKLQKVATTRVGEDPLTVAGNTVKADRYRMTGDERVDLWFNDSDIVLRVLYHNPNGSQIDFRAKSVPDSREGLGLPGR